MMAEALRDLTSLRSNVFGAQPKPTKPAPEIVQEDLSQRIARGQRAQEALPELGALESEATEQKLRAQQNVRKGVAEKKAGFEKTFAEETAKATQQRNLGLQENPEFKPDKMELDDYRNLAGMLVGLGALVGGKGKMGAMYSLQALNGMMEGYAQGRRDLFKTQQIEFDKQLKSIDANNKMIERVFNDAIAKINTDRQTALAELKVLEAELGDGVLAADLRLNDLGKFRSDLKSAIQAASDASKTVEQARQKEQDRELRSHFKQQELAMRQQGLDIRQMLADLKVSPEKNLKPPPKEIVAQNQLRNSLIPKLEEALPVLDRMNKEGKWSTMTTLLALPYGTNAAEATFKDDPEALNLILTLAYFRSKEFETAGKALTRKEDQILAPIVRGDLRVYEGMRNAMSQGLKTLKQEQAGLEKTYPYLEAYNKAFRGDVAEPSEPPKQLSEQDRAALAWANANPSDSRSAAIKARLGVQ
jgi:hypothetical protein